jgi:hypothetical protein
MSMRPGLLVLASLLPACLDPVVGARCAEGYSPCHGRCAVTCDVLDGGENAPDRHADGMPDHAFMGLEVEPKEVSRPALEVFAPVDKTAWHGEEDPDVLPFEVADVDVSDVPFPEDAVALPEVGLAMAMDTGHDDRGPCRDCRDGSDGGPPDAAGASPADAAGEAGNHGVDGMPEVPLACSDRQSVCHAACVDLHSDPRHCGDCDHACATGVCIAGTCLVCAADETACDGRCIKTAADPDHCGGCFVVCASGLCKAGRCEGDGSGRAVVIGHDYLKNRTAMNRVLGNAVFLWLQNPVHLLVYEGEANPAAIQGADGAIAQVATATGRTFERVATVAADVPTRLAASDVFLVYGQENAADATLTKLGQDWASALEVFVVGGGTVIVLDAVYAANRGTVQILAQAGIFQITRDGSATGDVCSVEAREDALATGLPRNYMCETNSATFQVADPATTVTSVVEDSGQPVVVDKIF